MYLRSPSLQNFCHVTAETQSDSSFFGLCITDWETLFPCHLFMKMNRAWNWCWFCPHFCCMQLTHTKYRERENEVSMKWDVFKQGACYWHRNMGKRKMSWKPDMWKMVQHVTQCFSSETLFFPGDSVAVDRGYERSFISWPIGALFVPLIPTVLSWSIPGLQCVTP